MTKSFKTTKGADHAGGPSECSELNKINIFVFASDSWNERNTKYLFWSINMRFKVKRIFISLNI